jgi:hypothetical protein
LISPSIKQKRKKRLKNARKWLKFQRLACKEFKLNQHRTPRSIRLSRPDLRIRNELDNTSLSKLETLDQTKLATPDQGLKIEI